MLKPTDALAVVISNTEAARRLEAEAQALKWPLEQLRKGHSIPPAVLIDVLEARQESCRATAGALLLISTLVAEAHRPVAAPPEPPVPPPRPWWRRIQAWFATAGGRARGTLP